MLAEADVGLVVLIDQLLGWTKRRPGYRKSRYSCWGECKGR